MRRIRKPANSLWLETNGMDVEAQQVIYGFGSTRLIRLLFTSAYPYRPLVATILSRLISA